jgi:hypothetical protein
MDNYPRSVARCRAEYIEQTIIPTLIQCVKYQDGPLLKANAPYILDELHGFVGMLESFAEKQVIVNPQYLASKKNK